MNEASEQPPGPQRAKRSDSWFRFSLRSLLLLVLLVAVFLSGRNSNRWLGPKFEGKWQLTMPAGFQKTVNIVRDPDGQFVVGTGGVLSGVYRWQEDRLVVVQPSDARMIGLAWAWNGETLQLMSEPEGTPTGASYLGAVMQRVEEDPQF